MYKRQLEDYSLIKFARSNAGTCINQRPIVEVGENVTAPDFQMCGHSLILQQIGQCLRIVQCIALVGTLTGTCLLYTSRCV